MKALILDEAKEGFYPVDLADKCNTSAASIGQTVDVLEGFKWVKRSYGEQEDKRKVKVGITRRGKEMLEEVFKEIEKLKKIA